MPQIDSITQLFAAIVKFVKAENKEIVSRSDRNEKENEKGRAEKEICASLVHCSSIVSDLLTLRYTSLLVMGLML